MVIVKQHELPHNLLQRHGQLYFVMGSSTSSWAATPCSTTSWAASTSSWAATTSSTASWAAKNMAYYSKRKVGNTNCSKNMAHCSKRKVGNTNCSKNMANCGRPADEVAGWTAKGGKKWMTQGPKTGGKGCKKRAAKGTKNGRQRVHKTGGKGRKKRTDSKSCFLYLFSCFL